MLANKSIITVRPHCFKEANIQTVLQNMIGRACRLAMINEEKMN